MTIVYLPDDMPLASVHRLAREHGLVVRWDHERGAFRVEAPTTASGIFDKEGKPK